MLRRKEGVVLSIETERTGAQEIWVKTADKEAPRLTLNLTELAGKLEVGDPVLINTIAVELGLGTGGLDFVIAGPLARVPQDTPPGHILKLRYTPLQTPVLAVEAPESPHHNALETFQSLEDAPVVCMELHSQLPAICAAIRWAETEHRLPRSLRVVYIMTDGSALPLALSRMIPQLRERNLLQGVITCGQAFGGDLEAINLYSALAVAKEVLRADILLVGQGPGNVGTHTDLGFSGVEQGQAVNAAVSLGGTAIVAPRISFAEKRPRHYGISRHTISNLKRVARGGLLLPIPRLPEEQAELVYRTLDALDLDLEIQPVVVNADKSLEVLLESGIEATTMGRKIEEDRAFFLAAAAAGLLAVQHVEARSGWDVRLGE